MGRSLPASRAKAFCRNRPLGTERIRQEVFPMLTLFKFSAALVAGTLALSAGMDQPMAQTAEPPLLQLETKIPLGDVRGRIDHLAIDLARRRLFVAELGNDSIGIVDLKNDKLLRTISGFKEPQGVAYLPEVDTLYVANAGDGSVQLLQGESYGQAGRIELGKDADNIRVDPNANRVFVGYGDGALAVIDPASRSKIAAIPLPAHPESFQLARAGWRARRAHVACSIAASRCRSPSAGGKDFRRASGAIPTGPRPGV